MTTDHENVLPPAVRRQVEQADAIIAQMNQQQQPPTDPNPAAIPTEPKQVTPPPAPPKPSDPPSDPPTDPEAKPREDWKHKYSVLKGKYDAEVPRLTADLRETRSALTQTREQLNTLQATVAALQEVNKKPPAPATPPVTPEEIEQFGPDLIDVVKRVAQEAVAPYVDRKVGEVSSSVKQVNESVASAGKTMAELARARVYERLDRDVQGWESINKSEKFVAWLHEEDGLSGEPRGAVLRRAFERNDADRVVKIFKGFQKEHVVETPDPGSSTPPADPPTDPAPEPQKNLDDLVAPGTPKTGSTDAQAESGKGRIWTQKDIRDFMAWKNEFVKKRPGEELPKDMAELERDLFKAQNEGRIRA